MRPLTRAPYRLPQKRKRPKSGIERAPQRIWLRHRKFVRSHHCVVPGCQATDIQFCHIRSAATAGTGLKPHDAHSFPACVNHHQEQHQIGQGSFEDRHGLDLDAIAAELVRRSPDMQMRLSLMEAGLYPDAPAVKAPPAEPKAPPPKYRLASDQPVRTLPFLGYVNSTDLPREDVA